MGAFGLADEIFLLDACFERRVGPSHTAGNGQCCRIPYNGLARRVRCASNVVDLSDCALFAACFTGPNNGPVADGCTCFDTDGDNDIDLPDFGVFQTTFTGR